MEQVIEGRIKHAVKGFVDELLEKLPEDGDFVANPEILTEQQTALLGAANVSSVTGETLSTLVPEWLLAVYVDNLAGFSSPSARMRVKSWNYRAIATNPANAQIFPNGFPLRPDSTSGSYTRSGMLRGGSGRHFRLIQPGNGAGIDVQVLKNAAGTALDAALVPRLGIVRIR